MAESFAFNRDCMEAMKEFPDKFFDLAVVDPPYGAGFTEGGGCQGWFSKYHQDSSQSVNVERERERQAGYNRFGSPGSIFERYKREPDGWNLGGEVRKKIISWDTAPGQEYFTELFRVSRNQIIWGGNYFELPPTRCFLIWRKLTISEAFSMAMAEYAWTSFKSNAKVFECAPQGNKEKRFHPTQKPVALYEWIFKRYAERGMKILDTHLGSGSSRIAAYDADLEFYGYEIDEEYFRLEEERFEKHTAQQNLFLSSEQYETILF